MIELLETKDEVRFLSDQITTPTFIDDIAGSLDILIEKNEQGIFHVVGNSFISPFEAGELIAKTFGLEKTKINTITLKELYEGRAKRPFHVKLKNDKLVDVGFKPKTFEEGLSLIQKTA